MLVRREFEFEAADLKLDTALKALCDFGIIVVRRAVPVRLAIAAHRRMVKASDAVAKMDAANYWRFRNHFLGSPGHIGVLQALSGELVDGKLLTPAGTYEVMCEYLGRDMFLHEWVDNINHGSNSHDQNCHRDEEIDAEGRPCGLVLNIATQRINASNGMTFFWLASHFAPFEQQKDPTGENLRFEGYQPSLEVGDIVLRDLALLHKGVANPSGQDRHMPSLVFNPQWQVMDPKFVRGILKSDRISLTPSHQHILRYHLATGKDDFLACPYPLPDC